jgi:hypothetical protein
VAFDLPAAVANLAFPLKPPAPALALYFSTVPDSFWPVSFSCLPLPGALPVTQ